ncbi:hypothetical protein PDIDSM_5948 [Penicillium digitatum]|nr:hypothetical protein PDIDSM_5948 [Penicillium digitatum]
MRYLHWKIDKGPDSQSRHRDAQFGTQRCLLGLQSGGLLDDCCPNVMLHRRSNDDPQHPITSEDLVRLLKAQLDENIDRCTPLGGCGAYGAPFKLTCLVYGYTVIGKGTTSALWTLQRPRVSKRRLPQPEIVDSKRLHVT